MGRRKFWSWHLLWELPVAYGMAMLGAGLSEYLKLTEKETLAAVAFLAYMGPHGIETVWSILLRRFDRGKCDDKK